MANRKVNVTKKELQEMFKVKTEDKEKEYAKAPNEHQEQEPPNESPHGERSEPEVVERSDTTPAVTERSEVEIEMGDHAATGEMRIFTEMESTYEATINFESVTTNVTTLCDVEQLLNIVSAIEMETCKKTLPVSVYGISEQVLTRDQVHEIVEFDNIVFLSNKVDTTDKAQFEKLVKEITLQLSINGEFRRDIVAMTILAVGDSYAKTPYLLVNTYEYNALRKVFAPIANVYLSDEYSSNCAMQLCVIYKE